MNNVKDFEKDINRLQEIVNILESGNISLEEVILLYEEGKKLTEKCQSSLNNASFKIEALSKNDIDSMEK